MYPPKFSFCLPGNGGVESRKDEFGARTRLQIFHFEARKIFAKRRRQSPGELAVGFSGRALARSDPFQMEPRVIGEQRDKLLPDGSSRAEDADFNFRLRLALHSATSQACTSQLWPPQRS